VRVFGCDEIPQIIDISCSNLNLLSSSEIFWSSINCLIATSLNPNLYFQFEKLKKQIK